MLSKLAKSMSACLRPGKRMVDDDEPDEDEMRWSKDLERHFAGEFSFAVEQGNLELEDHSQVETAPHALFVGVYDGHAGSQAACFVRDTLFLHLMNLAKENDTVTMSEDIIRNAFAATEDNFLSLVAGFFATRREIATVGSCCLVGIIWEETLYVASLGDSRAVIGHADRPNRIVPEQLSRDHNARYPEIRAELISMHPDDSQIVFEKNGAWRVKGIIQVTRSIGDAYLKRTEFALDASYPRFHLPEPLTRPVLNAEPTLHTQVLGPDDKFIIFASDGLWDLMTNQQAVDIVFNNPRRGIARRLLREALTIAATNRGMTYDEVRHTEQRKRRIIHDDITVIVIFIDHALLGKNISVPVRSIRGFVQAEEQSHFGILQRS